MKKNSKKITVKSLESVVETPNYERIGKRLADFLLHEEDRAIFDDYELDIIQYKKPEKTALFKATCLVDYDVEIPEIFEDDGEEIMGIEWLPEYGIVWQEEPSYTRDLAEFIWNEGYEQLHQEFIESARLSVNEIKKTILWDVICCLSKRTRVIRNAEFYHWYYKNRFDRDGVIGFDESKIKEFISMNLN